MLPIIYSYYIFNDTKNLIDDNQLIMIARYGFTDNAGVKVDGHWRVGVGYKSSDNGAYILMTDNGAESDHTNANGRTFINTITNVYCPYIFWENTYICGYLYNASVYKE